MVWKRSVIREVEGIIYEFRFVIYTDAQTWLDEDWRRIAESLGDRVEALCGKRVLVTGAAGFLGFGFLHFFNYLDRNFSKLGRMSVVAADNYIRGCPRWLIELTTVNPHLRLVRQDITKPWQYDSEGPFDFIIHAASIASPNFTESILWKR